MSASVTSFNEIFIGHTPTTNWQTDKPMRAANVINMDIGAGHSGRLTIMHLPSHKYWQSDVVTKLYQEKFRHWWYDKQHREDEVWENFGRT